jgi:hypothetical protein
MYGQIYYLTGGGIFFFVLKVLHGTILGKPFLLGGLAMLYGFLRAWMSGKKKLVSKSEAQFYRALLNARISYRLGQLVQKRPKDAPRGIS